MVDAAVAELALRSPGTAAVLTSDVGTLTDLVSGGARVASV
ncbi:hypothetical protein [Myceligenerans crystallogenes]|uniref:Uncharacterized protein n=1 Tax=Myceligenerans crystallogenes TaxID=316335 RepID=A0ABP4ZIK6_9MICO